MKRFLTQLAAAATAPTGFEIENPIGAKDLSDVIKTVTDAIRDLAIPVAVVMILWAGFNFLTAGGNPKNFQKGKDILWYTVIGLAVIFIGGGFVDLIKSVLNAGQ